MNKKEIIQKVIELYKDRNIGLSRSRDSFATDKHNQAILYSDTNAVNFCIKGAMYRVSCEHLEIVHLECELEDIIAEKEGTYFSVHAISADEKYSKEYVISLFEELLQKQ